MLFDANIGYPIFFTCFVLWPLQFGQIVIKKAIENGPIKCPRLTTFLFKCLWRNAKWKPFTCTNEVNILVKFDTTCVRYEVINVS